MPRNKTAVARGSPPEAGPTTAEAPPSDGILPSDGTSGAAREPAPPQPHGDGENRHPVFKVGPIPTDKNNAVSAAVWANEFVDPKDGRSFTVYNVTIEARWRDASGQWKGGRGFRGSQLYAVIYCLQRASDWICARRDPQNDCPF